MNKKIMITIVILLSLAISIRKYLKTQNVTVSSHIEQNDGVVIQTKSTGKTCASNHTCKSGNCYDGGL